MGWEDTGSVAVAFALMLSGAALVAPTAGATSSSEAPRIAVLDTGINPHHQAFASDQVVAWKDFVNGYADPYDDNGHGTLAAGMAAGANVGPQTDSLAPGADLAVAKVMNEDAILTERDILVNAVEWAVEDARADVITISIASSPEVQLDDEAIYDAFEQARNHGVLVLVSTGNGRDVGKTAGQEPVEVSTPEPSWTRWPKATDDALIVGGAHSSGTFEGYPWFFWDGDVYQADAGFASSDPEVTADYDVRGPGHDCSSCYVYYVGTSFGTPRVAGLAAHLIEYARDDGLDADPDRVERAIQKSADDHVEVPPNLEGYGYVDASSMNEAEGYMEDLGGLSATELANDVYARNVQDTMRTTWSS